MSDNNEELIALTASIVSAHVTGGTSRFVR